MMGSSTPSVVAENSALIMIAEINSFADADVEQRNQRKLIKAKFTVIFEKKLRHTRETYWKIHGKPANWKNNRVPDKANSQGF